jgi:hypothetical protein
VPTGSPPLRPACLSASSRPGISSSNRLAKQPSTAAIASLSARCGASSGRRGHQPIRVFCVHPWFNLRRRFSSFSSSMGRSAGSRRLRWGRCRRRRLLGATSLCRFCPGECRLKRPHVANPKRLGQAAQGWPALLDNRKTSSSLAWIYGAPFLGTTCPGMMIDHVTRQTYARRFGASVTALEVDRRDLGKSTPLKEDLQTIRC